MNISNKQLALQTGLHPAHVSRLRNGQRLPSITTVWVLHRKLGLDIYQLVEAAAMGRASFGKFMQLKTRQEGEELVGIVNRPLTMEERNTILATPEEWQEVVKLARYEPEWVTVSIGSAA